MGEAQLVVPKTQFGQATTIAEFFDGEPFDGILGLAFTELSVDYVTPPLINAINQGFSLRGMEWGLGLLDQHLFTVYLMHDYDGENIFGGIFTYGGVS